MKLKQPLTYKKYRRIARSKQISRISGPKWPNVSIPWPHDVVKLPTVCDLLFGLTPYESFGFKLRFGYLSTFANSKLRKRASNRHLSVKGAGLSFGLG